MAQWCSVSLNECCIDMGSFSNDQPSNWLTGDGRVTSMTQYRLRKPEHER